MNKKVAVVTGAAGIVGPSICQALRRHGWLVAAADLREEDFKFAQRVRNIEEFWDFRWIGDLRKKESCEGLIDACQTALGEVALLVNNAAFCYREPSLDALEEEQALSIFQINVLAPLWLTAAAQTSLGRTQGCVVNVSSAQTQGWLPENHLYVASKAALEKLTETLSATLGKDGARCVGIRLGSFPGFQFLSPFLSQLPQDAADKMVAELLPRHLAESEKSIGKSFVGQAGELGDTIAFLASDAARMVNGTILSMDGGMTTRPMTWASGYNSLQMAQEWFDNWKKEHETDQS
jgi:NAD(P)-dependent dehydrogenase (short-subunit alcohol dehydrogenase family)